MSEHIPSEPTPADSGHENNGSFAKGNKFGRGNPFARKVAAFRSALMEAVTEQDIQDIAAKLRDDAKAGDKAATKLLFQYVIGKPQATVDPDTLDGQEMRTFAANTLPPEALEEMGRMLPLGWLLQIWPLFRECMERQVAGHMGDKLAAMDERHQRRAERAQKKAERKQRRQEARERARQAHASAVQTPPTNGNKSAAVAGEESRSPSPNGDNGHTGFTNGHKPPSPNGDNGHDLMSFFAQWLNSQRRSPKNGQAD